MSKKKKKAKRKKATEKAAKKTSKKKTNAKKATESDAAFYFIKLNCLFPHRQASADVVRSKLVWWRGCFYFWNEGKYARIPDAEMKAKIAGFLRQSDIVATHNMVNKIILNLQAMVMLDSETQPGSWINSSEGPRAMVAQNGIIAFGDVGKKWRPKLLPFTPDYFTLAQLPYNYDLKAKCPKWLKFLNEVMEGDAERIRLLQQWTGYLLTPTLREQKFLICFGEGANGKGVFFAVVTAMLGSENCSSLPLSRFGQRFALSSTHGKLLNATNEGTGEITPHAEAILKEYTAGDMMTFERKYKEPFHAIPTAKLMFATNELPRFADKTEGVWRRMLPVPFEVTFPEKKQNKNLADELKKELPGIFNWAYGGMVDLEKNGFVVPSKCKVAIEQYRLDVNPAKVFLQENYCEDSEAQGVPCGSLYSKYRDWCKDRGYKPLNEANLGKEIKRVFPQVQKRRPRRNGKRTPVYANLAVQKNADITNPDVEWQYTQPKLPKRS
jgi:P4 family phage/plasmid primase-like protien